MYVCLIVKTRGYNVAVLTYVYVHVCMYVCMYVCLRNISTKTVACASGRNCHAESGSAEKLRARKVVSESVEYIGPYHVTGSKCKVYFCAAQIQNARTKLKAHSTWLLCPIKFPKLFNLLTPYYFLFREQLNLGSYFSRIFLLQVVPADMFKHVGV